MSELSLAYKCKRHSGYDPSGGRPKKFSCQECWLLYELHRALVSGYLKESR